MRIPCAPTWNPAPRPWRAGVATLGRMLAWAFLPLETPAWQRVLAARAGLFPQLAVGRVRAGDPLRCLIQAAWLACVRPRPVHVGQRLRAWPSRVLRLARQALAAPAQVPVEAWAAVRTRRFARGWLRLAPRTRRVAQALLGLAAVGAIVLCVTQPFGYLQQAVFGLVIWVLAMAVRRRQGRTVELLLILLSLVVSTRYLWWRYTATVDWANATDTFFGLGLLLAETYAWVVLILGYLQSAYPLERKPVPLPRDAATWPTVDLFIPTYNESLAVVRNTVYGALRIDWPRDKLRIHVLDDGSRAQFRDFAASVGVGYIVRTQHDHAKAGNLNHALGLTDGELIAVFDCDHVPVRSFLQATVGWFLRDPRIALVQTPHLFFSADPFERNLNTFRNAPNEGELFYGLVQDGNDLWDATFFCGSCAVVRRSALAAVGGFAVETVTEDAHTALRMHRAGWRSAYIRIPQAAGLATDSLAVHVNQRIRWARGMAQIFRIDNPLFGRGLSLMQRVCYLNAMLHFLSGIPRLIFLTAPLAFLLLHAYIIYAPALLLLVYVLPHMVQAAITNARLYGEHRATFWSEVYETVLAWYITLPTTVALLSPRRGKFNVTAKDGANATDHFDWRIARPYLVLAGLNVLGLGLMAWRLATGPADEVGTVIISGLWTLYNLLIIGAAIAVALEVRQVRASHRVQTSMPASLRLADGHAYAVTVTDFSSGGAGFRFASDRALKPGSQVDLVLGHGQREFAFSARVYHVGRHGSHGLRFEPMTHAQAETFVQCTFGRADAWLDWRGGQRSDRVVHDLLGVLQVGAHGYGGLLRSLPRMAGLGRLLAPLPRGLRWLASYRPRMPRDRAGATAPLALELET